MRVDDEMSFGASALPNWNSHGQSRALCAGEGCSTHSREPVRCYGRAEWPHYRFGATRQHRIGRQPLVEAGESQTHQALEARLFPGGRLVDRTSGIMETLYGACRPHVKPAPHSPPSGAHHMPRAWTMGIPAAPHASPSPPFLHLFAVFSLSCRSNVSTPLSPASVSAVSAPKQPC